MSQGGTLLMIKQLFLVGYSFTEVISPGVLHKKMYKASRLVWVNTSGRHVVFLCCQATHDM